VNISPSITKTIISDPAQPKSGTKPRQKSRQIYFSDEVLAELDRLKKEQRLNISAFVDQAVKAKLEQQ